MAGSACGAAHFNRRPFRVTTHCTGAAGRAAFNFQLIHGGPVNGNVTRILQGLDGGAALMGFMERWTAGPLSGHFFVGCHAE